MKKPKQKPTAAKRPAAKKRPVKKPSNGGRKAGDWVMVLYVAGQTPKSLTAFANLKKLCEEHLTQRYRIEVVDLSKQPELARNDQIVALPTLIRRLPEPIKRVIGDLSNSERVMVGMDLKQLGD